jgi:predicted transcriptional regulator
MTPLKFVALNAPALLKGILKALALAVVTYRQLKADEEVLDTFKQMHKGESDDM